ncbi:hypothetical protein INS49_001752 [Diaporthe citri]|uniref:uncharacterized protein n=1 Tax=Diaporthe citri TaxID=83186 RepID=UPI001C808D3D|nr:uncharacterized protein INS49_001752 [Diaporthe citri]KAG6367559.1 hypothetical protein INS49_001752 [Diaporthe citri]
MIPAQYSAPQDPVVDMLWKQLTELNAAVDATGDRWISLGSLQCKIMEMGQHESVKEDFEDEIRNLKILQSRRFCATSSHLLMIHVKVDMTPQSLARLDRISRHSTISKGIRAIKICLGRHFDPDISNDIQAFARYQGTRMRGYINFWELSVQHRHLLGTMSRGNMSMEALQRAIERGTILADSFDEATRRGLDETCPEHVLLRVAQECYRQHYESQLLLQHGPFVQDIVSAMMRMPTAIWLSIQDEDIGPVSGPDWESEIIDPEDMEDLDTLRLKLQAPSFSWSTARYCGLGSPPVDVIPNIFLSIGEAGIRLTGLDIDVPLPDNLSSFSRDQVETSKMQASSQQLKAFACRARHDRPPSTEAIPTLIRFLSTILQTSSLQRIDLWFDSGLQPIASIAPILFSRSWPSLKELSFSGPFHFQDLRKLVNHIGKNVELQWSGYLMDGPWAGVLDFLRDCRLHATLTLGDVNGSIAGAECEIMSMRELDYIFRENDVTPSLASESRASRYIRGWTTQNPVTDWMNGDLEMAELPRDDSEIGEYQESDTISDDS